MLQRKPHKDALPSEFGWFLPKTGELLVSIRGLANPVVGYVPNRPYLIQTTSNSVTVEAVEINEQPTSNAVEIIEVTTRPIVEDDDAKLNFLADNNIITMPTSDIAIDAVKSITKPKSKAKN